MAEQTPLSLSLSLSLHWQKRKHCIDGASPPSSLSSSTKPHAKAEWSHAWNLSKAGCVRPASCQYSPCPPADVYLPDRPPDAGKGLDRLDKLAPGDRNFHDPFGRSMARPVDCACPYRMTCFKNASSLPLQKRLSSSSSDVLPATHVEALTGLRLNDGTPDQRIFSHEWLLFPWFVFVKVPDSFLFVCARLCLFYLCYLYASFKWNKIMK